MQNPWKSVGLALALPLVLTACGGTGGSASGPETFDSAQEYFDAGEEIFNLISDDVDAGNFDNPAALPTTGVSSYFGSLYIENVANEGVIGAMRLDANFSDESITGEVTGIVDFDDDPVSGQMNIVDGVIDRTVDVELNYTFVADLTGSLTSSTNESIVIDGELTGDFFNNQGQVYGGVSGTATIDGTPNTVGGEFLGAR